MVVTPALPPYAHLDEAAVQCVAEAAARYEVPELLLHAILMKENGRMGKCSKNKNGTYDCGLAQINTSWLAHFAKYGVTFDHLTKNVCTNVSASAYILKKNYLVKQQNWFDSIISYNIGPNSWTPNRYTIGYKYAREVVDKWWGFQRYVESNSSTAQQPQAPKASNSPRATPVAQAAQSRVHVYEAP